MTETIQITLTEGMDGLSLRIAQQDGGSAVAVLNAAELEQLITDLGNARMGMSPPVAPAPENGDVSAVVSPIWASPDGAVPGGRALAIRHPGLGWLHFIFRGDHALDLANAMSRDAMIAITGDTIPTSARN